MGALTSNLLKALTGSGVNRIFAGEFLPTSDCHVDVVGLDLQAIADPANPLGGENRGPGACKSVENDVAAPGAVPQCVRHQGYRFRRRMGLQFIHAAGPESVDPGVVPNV